MTIDEWKMELQNKCFSATASQESIERHLTTLRTVEDIASVNLEHLGRFVTKHIDRMHEDIRTLGF